MSEQTEVREEGFSHVSDSTMEEFQGLKAKRSQGRPKPSRPWGRSIIFPKDLEDDLIEVANDFGDDIPFSWIVKKACRMYVAWYKRQREGKTA